MNLIEVTARAAGVGNHDSCLGPLPLAPTVSDSQSALDELDASQESCTSEPCELDKPMYKTDEFRLYQFKITQCTNEEAHDWCLCPFAHPGEKAQRRDPRLYKYTGISCPDYRKGTCKRGNACPYAHGAASTCSSGQQRMQQLAQQLLLLSSLQANDRCRTQQVLVQRQTAASAGHGIPGRTMLTCTHLA
eukprot:GHRQ01003491.1.p1 GENE.GHRQ01003491.1~~GHRQ01003491.1.p1  ORF type:complete len:190 (+),score=38.00 GHRQ01003491.1:299-868(+)